MKISIHTDSSLPPHAGELIQRRCESAFARFESDIDEVFVTLTDENGPKGGESIRCVVRVQVPRRPDVIIHEQSDIFERALGLAVERASYQVARNHGKRVHNSRAHRRTERTLVPEAVPA
jgi:hypothetical protein